MGNALSRRQRRVILTAILGMVLIAVLVSFFMFTRKPPAPYRPGENIEGLSDELSRVLPEDLPAITFRDAAREAGINFTHFSGIRSIQLPEDMGSGAAWGDYDNDGWMDLYVVNQYGPLTMTLEEMKASTAHSSLFHNNGDGTFTEVSLQAGVALIAMGMAAAWGDSDNDGLMDLFVSCYGENVFYHNNGDGTFTNFTNQSGLGGRNGFWTGVTWTDYNRDGFLDIYVCGYVKYAVDASQVMTKQYNVQVPASINPSSFEPERNLLYRNNGDGTFSEVAEKAGINDPDGKSLSASWCDFDEDGWPDVYVANDVSDNALFRNLGDETFENISHESWVADYRGAMGIGVGDWDRDQDMDLFITHWIAQENALYDNMKSQLTEMGISGKSNIRFMDEADRYGLGQIALDYIGWGTAFFDYDNDGRLDIFVTNGSTFQQTENTARLIPMDDLLFWNGGEQGFYNVSGVSGAVFGQKHVGRGAAFADFDNDGDVDIFVVNNGEPGQLLKNEGGNQHNWLKLRLEGVHSNRLAIGARIRLVAGDAVQVAQVGAQSSYLSQNSQVQHFGLGMQASADTIEIFWPGGANQQLLNIDANQTLTISEEPR